MRQFVTEETDRAQKSCSIYEHFDSIFEVPQRFTVDNIIIYSIVLPYHNIMHTRFALLLHA